MSRLAAVMVVEAVHAAEVLQETTIQVATDTSVTTLMLRVGVAIGDVELNGVPSGTAMSQAEQ